MATITVLNTSASLSGKTLLIAEGSLTPGTTAVYDVGNTSFKYRDGWFSRNVVVGGNLTLSGTLDVTGAATLASTLGVVGNFAVNTNKFTVAASSGNTAVAGTLGVTGILTATGGLMATGAIQGSSGSSISNNGATGHNVTPAGLFHTFDGSGGFANFGLIDGFAAPAFPGAGTSFFFLTGADNGAAQQTLVHNGSGSSAANRVFTSTGADMDITSSADLILLVYNPIAAHWQATRLAGS